MIYETDNICGKCVASVTSCFTSTKEAVSIYFYFFLDKQVKNRGMFGSLARGWRYYF